MVQLFTWKSAVEEERVRGLARLDGATCRTRIWPAAAHSWHAPPRCSCRCVSWDGRALFLQRSCARCVSCAHLGLTCALAARAAHAQSDCCCLHARAAMLQNALTQRTDGPACHHGRHVQASQRRHSASCASAVTAAKAGLLFECSGAEDAWDGGAVANPVVRVFPGQEGQRWFLWYTGRAQAAADTDAALPAAGSIGAHLECRAAAPPAQRVHACCLVTAPYVPHLAVSHRSPSCTCSSSTHGLPHRAVTTSMVRRR